MVCITESGCILDFSEFNKGGDILEYSNGRWSKAVFPVSSDNEFNARVLIDSEFSKLLKSGKFN